VSGVQSPRVSAVAKGERSRFGTEITHCQTGTGGMT
jgi:predicted XRE-type DNA-binding protein